MHDRFWEHTSNLAAWACVAAHSAIDGLDIGAKRAGYRHLVNTTLDDMVTHELVEIVSGLTVYVCHRGDTSRLPGSNNRSYDAAVDPQYGAGGEGRARAAHIDDHRGDLLRRSKTLYERRWASSREELPYHRSSIRAA